MPKHDFSKMLLTASSADKSGVRRETFQDKEHLVVPIVALVEGVIHSGNAPFPELALASEFGKIPESWNGRPVTINHPMSDGINVSASQTPSIFEKEAIGFLFNTKMDGTKLKTEAWINLEVVANGTNLAQDTIARLEANDEADVVEVSTGLFQMMEANTGRFNNEQFMGIWREVVPDHLAILEAGSRGACSVADGCGARVNAMRVNCACEKQTTTNDEKKDSTKDGVLELDKDHYGKARVSFLQGLKEKFAGIFFTDNAGAELSDSDTRMAISAALKSEDAEKWYDIVAVFNKVFIYCASWDGALDQRSYKISSNGAVVLGSEKVRVRPETTFVPVTFKEDTRMNKKELIDGLIANSANKFVEEDRATLEALDEGMLTKLSSVDKLVEEPKEEKKTEVVANAATPEEFLKTVPEEMRSMFSEGLRMQKEHKDTLVKGLVANARNTFSETELRAMEISSLEKLAKLGDLPSFQGRQGSVIATNSADDENAAPKAPQAFPVKQ